jgi:hypothetical protein
LLTFFCGLEADQIAAGAAVASQIQMAGVQPRIAAQRGPEVEAGHPFGSWAGRAELKIKWQCKSVGKILASVIFCGGIRSRAQPPGTFNSNSLAVERNSC